MNRLLRKEKSHEGQRKRLMPIAKTVTGRLFEYSRLLGNGPDDFLQAPHKKIIPVEIIKVIRREITKRSPVLMGPTVNRWLQIPWARRWP